MGLLGRARRLFLDSKLKRRVRITAYSLLRGIMKNIKIVQDPVKILREKRKEICFPVINRGKLWYDTLTPLQLGELKSWYWEWLNVTETLVIPKKPVWLDDKLVEEEVLI